MTSVTQTSNTGWRLTHLAAAVNGQLHGDHGQRVMAVAPLARARGQEIAFLSDQRLLPLLEQTQAGAVILRAEHYPKCPTAAIAVADPQLAFARIAALLHPPAPAVPGVHPSSSVADDARIDPSASVGPLCVIEPGARIQARAVLGPQCVIGAGVEIGPDTRLVARVTILAAAHIGARCLFHPGSVVGSDGFGYARDGVQWVRIPQLGSVSIEDDVEIGANTTIDRGALDDTVIRRGVKLDNQIQVAHNVEIGEDTAMAGCVGISGSTRIGARCTVGGGAGFAGHLEIADDVHIAGMAMVTKSLGAAGAYGSGLPVEPQGKWRRSVARVRQLEALTERVRALESKLHNNKGDDR